MANNYIVLRASPDWLNFNLEDSRPFCRKVGLPDDLIVRLASLWQQTLGVDLRRFRHDMKQIALASIAGCQTGELRELADLPARAADDDLFYFTDDDDWVAPHLFEALRANFSGGDGFLWKSLAVAKLLNSDAPFLQKRRFDDIIYTNNYAVTGRALKLLGVPAVFEHYAAQTRFDGGDLKLDKIPEYLTCTNKHPCSAVWAQFNLELAQPDFRSVIAGLLDEIRKTRLDDESRWISPYLDLLEDVVARAMGGKAS